jgi:phosphoglycerate dehydrogenase-like enzyme
MLTKSDVPNILLYGALVYDLLEVLQRKLQIPANIFRVKENIDPVELADKMILADVVIALKYAHMPAAPRLQLLQIPGAGLDQIKFEQVPPQATICNAYGHDVAGGEYVVMSMLAWCHQLIPAHQSMMAGSWHMSGRTGAPLHDELEGKTVGILGLGPIGLAAAKRAKAFGTTVIGCNRTLREKPDYLAKTYSLDQLHEFLRRCDFVAVCIALTPQTVALIDRAALAQMKPNAVIINVARGAIIEEDALYEALATKQIGGAVIDAWYRYPTPDDLTIPPSKRPFATLPNVIMTPHSSIWTHGMIERRWTDIAANIDALCDGGRLKNIVRRPLG